MRKNLTFRLLALLLLSALTISYFAIDIVQAQDIIWARASDPTDFDDEAYDVAVDGSGLYIVGGHGWRVQKRSLATGSIIWVPKTSASFKDANGVAVDSSGLYVVGADWLILKLSRQTGGIIWRSTSNPDPTGNTVSAAFSVAVHRTGLYVVGSYHDYNSSQNCGWRVAKHSLTTGRLIWTRTSNPSSYDDFASDVAVDDTGLYVVGFDSVAGLTHWTWRVEKRSLLTGSRIWVKRELRARYATHVAVDSSGLYIVGVDNYGGASWRIEKCNPKTGLVVWSKISNPSTGPDYANGVAVASDALYVVGFDSVLPGTEETSNTRWRIEKRSKKDGALLWARARNYDQYDEDEARAVAVDRTGIYVVGNGRAYARRGRNWQIEKRHL